MTEHHDDNDPAVLDQTESRGAKPVKGMPWVLGGSIAAVLVGIVIFVLIFFA
ncbi:hypothetical protein [Robiginitomaculum antarcticum]|uniref:hypothetical protein n=1 Tax=Robiginitomaculum antarcticum TaxID=437507 RepID=UPI0014613098|nr:hypothetical protein [Robiginitomaculum antarcticum]